jgi:hypothetical protein
LIDPSGTAEPASAGLIYQASISIDAVLAAHE